MAERETDPQEAGSAKTGLGRVAGLSHIADLSRIALLIPARDPDAQLGALLAELIPWGFGCVLLVDDGSSPRSAAVFAEAASHCGVTVLRHEVNRGKGRSLKTGMEAFLQQQPSLQGLVTADADGQHTAADILRVAIELAEGGSHFVFGARVRAGIESSAADATSIPLRSALGNRLTRFLFHWLFGLRLHDTQSGLRGFTPELVPSLLRIPGERYEFETAVLIELWQAGVQPLEVPVSTVYLEGNRHSHFRPLADSLRVYAALLRPKLLPGRAKRAPDSARHPRHSDRPERSEGLRPRH